VRAAIVGAGPAGFYAAEALLRRQAPVFAVDLFERLPTPFGLVRSGVAPDHQKIKTVIRAFERTAQHPRFRFLGHVEVGRDLSAEELAQHYDQVVYAVGSASDRQLGIPGEDLAGCHGAAAFVGWYNGHPDFVDLAFDFDTPRAIIVGVGDVALDVARILLRRPDELAGTDISGRALAALRASRIREVVLMARRGAAQVAFSPAELHEIAELEGVAVVVDPASLEVGVEHLDALEPRCRKNVDLLRTLAGRAPRPGARPLRVELLASPVEVLAGAPGRMGAVRVERNTLSGDPLAPKARGTGEFFTIEAGLLFRSVGYRATALPGVPFDERAGVIPNRDGRVLDPAQDRVLPGIYAVGWIRRGPTGVIGTNKADAQSVAELMAADVPACAARAATPPPPGAIDDLLRRRGVRVVGYADWLAIDAVEVARGRSLGKVRDKIERVDEMLAVLDAR
jgi:ferredoxin--NADP+ reductase